MYVLKELWRGNISPTERFVRPESEYAAALRQLNPELEKLRNGISPEARRQMEVVEDLRSRLAMLENEEYFLYGFRLGAGLILDIAEPYRGQFSSPGERG